MCDSPRFFNPKSSSRLVVLIRVEISKRVDGDCTVVLFNVHEILAHIHPNQTRHA